MDLWLLHKCMPYPYMHTCFSLYTYLRTRCTASPRIRIEKACKYFTFNPVFFTYYKLKKETKENHEYTTIFTRNDQLQVYVKGSLLMRSSLLFIIIILCIITFMHFCFLLFLFLLFYFELIDIDIVLFKNRFIV